MIDWFKSLFYMHKYATIKEGRYVDYMNETTGRWYNCRCEKCGRIKIFRCF